MEMEIGATEDVGIGEDLFSSFPPLAFSLHDFVLSSHCSSCFSPLPPNQPPFPPLLTTSTTADPSASTLLYCSASCSRSDSPLHRSSSESHLQSLPYAASDILSSSDIRLALRLLHVLSSSISPTAHRIGGLLTNRDGLMSSEESDVRVSIREGAIAMAEARRRSHASYATDFVLEETVLCLVVTNAVEVLDITGRPLGVAVYDAAFSWINHSCSPNACYRFDFNSRNVSSLHEGSKMLRMGPRGTKSCSSEGENGYCSNIEFHQGRREGYGPRIIVRSIKRITKGEEVTVSYTGLLQPKAIRQAELQSKYQFICSCRRCNPSSQSYVDSALEGIDAWSQEFTYTSSKSCANNFHRGQETRKLIDYVDETITEFLSVGDPESCCKKLEYMLRHGVQGLETIEEKRNLNFGFHPFHHLALNSYMTLASAYKIRSCSTEIDQNQSEVFRLKRTSAAYSLMLAGTTHHLFRSDTSLIASAANFWTSAGESLLTLVQTTSAWGLLPPSLSPLYKQNCTKCSLIDIFETDFESRQTNFEGISEQFLTCVNIMTREVWSFLNQGCEYLQLVEDPVDYKWLEDLHGHLANDEEDAIDSINATMARSIGSKPHGYTGKNMVCILQLGIHCLLYGGYLANICYGRDSHLVYDIRSLLCE